MEENQVWNLIELPEGCNLVKSKWVYKRKLGSEGEIIKYKARLVAKGYSQIKGIDYDETFSPVARFESVRTLLALAAQNDLHVHQMDVTSAFLNGELQEDIYMSQPEGYVCKGKEDLVCKLKRSIYGLKQSSRCWNSSLNSYLKKLNFVQSVCDPCIYVKGTENPLILAVYVDDIILICKSASEIQSVKCNLMNQYKMSDLGQLKYFLGVKVDQNVKNGTIFLSQSAYAERLINKFGMSEANPVKTPIEPNFKFDAVNDDNRLSDPVEYQSVIGSLLYLATKTRPDICFAVGKLARYCSNPSKVHWLAAKGVIRYLKGTVNYGLLYSRSEAGTCVGFSDADWAGDLTDRKSTSGYTFQMSGASVSWLSSKQTCVALSTAEAEYLALSKAAQEAIWLQQFLASLKFPCDEPMLIHEDNQAAISISKEFVCSKRTKHIDIKFHYVRDQVNDNKIVIDYCSSSEMVADILTKGLTYDKFAKFRKMLGLTCV